MTGFDDDVWEAFNAAIAEEDREDVLTMMSEAAHDDRYHTEEITILNRTKHNVINVTVEGIVKYNGSEYTFHLSSGDWNGTELHGWGEFGSTWEEPEPVILAIAPRSDIVSDAFRSDGNPAFLIAKWKLFENREDVNKLLREYAYDRHFQPGGKVENHYKDKLAAMGLVITTKEDADAIKARLQKEADARCMTFP